MPFDISPYLGIATDEPTTSYQAERAKRMQSLQSIVDEMRQQPVVPPETTQRESPYGIATPALELLDPALSLASGAVTSLAPFSAYLHSRVQNLLGPATAYDPRGYKEFMDAAKAQAGQETYAPRTKSGAMLTSIASAPMWLAEKYADVAEQQALNFGAPPDMAAVIKDAYMLGGMYAMGKVGHDFAPTVKAKLNKFIGAAKELGPESPEVMQQAQNIAQTVSAKPAVAQAVAGAQADLVRPTQLWEAYQRGETTLPGGTNELALKIADRLKQPEHNLPLTQPQFEGMVGEVDTLRAESQMAKEDPQQYARRVNEYFANLKGRLKPTEPTAPIPEAQLAAEQNPANWRQVDRTEYSTGQAARFVNERLKELEASGATDRRYRIEQLGKRRAAVITEQYAPIETAPTATPPVEGQVQGGTQPSTVTVGAAQPETIPASQIGEVFSGMGKGIRESYVDMLWDRYNKSEVRDASGTLDLGLQMANRMKQEGLNLTRDQLENLARDVDSYRSNLRKTGVAGDSYQKSMLDFYNNYKEQLAPKGGEVAGATGTEQSTEAPLQQAINIVLDPESKGKTRQQAIADVKAAAREGLRGNEKTAIGLKKLGFTDEQIAATAKDFANVRAKRLAPPSATAVKTEGSDVATRIAELDSQLTQANAERSSIEQAMEAAPEGTKGDVDRLARAYEKIDTLTKQRERLQSQLPAEKVPSNVIRPSEAPIIPEQPTKLNYTTVGNLAELQSSMETGTTGGTEAPTIAPLQIRSSGGKPTAILFDPAGLNALTPAEQLGRQSPEMAAAITKQLQRQADIAGVPIEQAHLYTADEIQKQLIEIAKEKNLDLYRAKKVKGEIVYEKVPEAEISALDKLNRATSDAPGLTREEATAHIAKGTENIGNEAVAEIVRSIEQGQDISDMFPPDVAAHVKDMVERYQRAAQSNEPVDYSDILNNIKNLLGEETGAISFQQLNQMQKNALLFLKAQADRVGQNILEVLSKIPRAKPNIDLFKEYLDHVAQPPPADALTPRNTRITEANAGDSVAKHRSITLTRDAIPVWKSEESIFQNSRNVPYTPMFALRNPGRWMSQAGLYDPVMYAYRTAEQRAHQARNALGRSIRDASREFDSYSRERIGAYGLSQDTDGMRILNKMGVKVPTLTPREMEAYNTVRGIYEDFFQQINDTRQSIGQEPLNYTPNYFTRMRTLSAMERWGFTGNLVRDSARNVEKRFTSYADTPFPYERLRKRASYSAQLDAFKLLDTYGRSAVRQVNMAPFVAKIHELIDTKLTDPVTGELTWEFKRNKPDTYRMMRDWLDFVATGKSEYYKLPMWAETAMRTLSNNLAYSMLSGTVRSALVQESTLRNTYQAIGAKYTFKGIEDVMSDIFKGTNYRDEAYALSKHLDVRKMDVYQNDFVNAIIGRNVTDVARAIGQGRIGEVQRAIASVGLKPLEFLDQQAALYTWRGAFRHAKEILSQSDRKFASDMWAARYADDIVIKTQGSAMPGDLAAVQRSTLGKAFTQFQTFAISDFNFLKEDVLGIGANSKLSPKQVATNIARFVGATFAINTLMEIAHIQSPFPTPLKDMSKPIDPDENAALALAGRLAASGAELFPILSATKYGKGLGGPAIEITRDLFRSLRGDPLAPPIGENLAKVSGVPFTQQIAKMGRASRRGENVYDSLLGWYTQGGAGTTRAGSSSHAR